MVSLRAPGRINLIGEHTDHGGGLSLPAAIDRGVRLEISGGADRIELRSQGREPASVAADGSGSGEGWARFPAAVAAELHALGRRSVGIEGEISSDLPAEAGLASSAALTVAVAMALCEAADFSLEPMTLAELCRRAEERAVGVPCGVMDHAASIFGRSDHAVFLNAATGAVELVPLPSGLRFVVLHSGVVRRLEDSAYRLRREELQRGLAGSKDPVSVRRLRHFDSEDRRVREVVGALRGEPPDVAAVGVALLAGHISLRDDFEVSTTELDLLVEMAMARGAIGARLTGAGFGGAVVALAFSDDADAIGSATIAAYRERFPALDSRYLVCRAADGAARV